MFKMLLKYDMKASKRFAIPISIGILVAGLLGALAIIVYSSLVSQAGENFFVICGMIISMLVIMAVFCIVWGGPAIMIIIILVDFYKNLGTDEGYLTFTLPVKAKDIILSKVANCTIWSVVTGLASFVAYVIISIASSVSGGGILDGALDPGIDFGIADASFVWLFILAILLSIASFFNSVLLYFDAIFFGTVIAKKNKALSAFLCVLAVNTIYGIVVSIVLTIAIISGASLAASSTDPLAVVNIILAVFTVLLTALNVVFFEHLRYLMEKKLNLA